MAYHPCCYASSEVYNHVLFCMLPMSHGILFGIGEDVTTVASKVLFDQLVLTPFLCLPAAYLFKAVAFSYPVREGLRRYVADARRDLLLKYWALWTPVQCLTFGVIAPQWRIPFIALVSFFWLVILSSISSRDDQVDTGELAVE